MSNMSYCRFENTLRDLQDCLEHINDDDMSADEIRARTTLIKTCEDICDEAMPIIKKEE